MWTMHAGPRCSTLIKDLSHLTLYINSSVVQDTILKIVSYLKDKR
jgi:hypothetical protein